MEKPIKRTNKGIQSYPNFVDTLEETYQPKLNSAGFTFQNPLDYITEEVQDYMNEYEEKAFINEHGLAPIAFLSLLRIQMSKTSGFGICCNNNDLEKALFSIYLDYGIEIPQLKAYCSQLLDAGMLIKISSLKSGNTYLTCRQQIWNYEYKEYSKWQARTSQANRRKKEKSSQEDNAVKPQVAPVPVKEIKASGEDFFAGGDDDFSIF